MGAFEHSGYRRPLGIRLEVLKAQLDMSNTSIRAFDDLQFQDQGLCNHGQ